MTDPAPIRPTGPAQFFMVCRAPSHAGSVTNPQHRFPTRADAETVARRLARENNANFVILQSVAVVTPAPDPFAKGLL
jgi:hypothetical protein